MRRTNMNEAFAIVICDSYIDSVGSGSSISLIKLGHISVAEYACDLYQETVLIHEGNEELMSRDLQLKRKIYSAVSEVRKQKGRERIFEKSIILISLMETSRPCSIEVLR